MTGKGFKRGDASNSVDIRKVWLCVFTATLACSHSGNAQITLYYFWKSLLFINRFVLNIFSLFESSRTCLFHAICWYAYKRCQVYVNDIPIYVDSKNHYHNCAHKQDWSMAWGRASVVHCFSASCIRIISGVESYLAYSLYFIIARKATFKTS